MLSPVFPVSHPGTDPIIKIGSVNVQVKTHKSTSYTYRITDDGVLNYYNAHLMVISEQVYYF